MKTFIKATEIWAPCRQSLELEIVSSSYDESNKLLAASTEKRFAYDQGLPGKAWSAGHPLVLTSLDGSYFERTEAARSVGITAAIAMPIFAGDCLLSVVVFLCGEDDSSVGAIEVWHCDTDNSYDLSLMDGYFGSLERFEFVSRHTSFRKGTGLPGLVWENDLPILMQDLGKSHRFVRSKEAKEAGMTAGIGFPVHHRPKQVYIIAFLSALGTPIARQVEVWALDKKRDELIFKDGFSVQNVDLANHYKDVAIARGQGVIGRVFLTGLPMIIKGQVDSVANEGDFILSTDSDSRCTVIIPLMKYGFCVSIITLYF